MAKDFKVGGRIAQVHYVERERFSNNSGLFVGTEDLAWLYGFYAAEGWIRRNHLEFSNKNKALLEKAQKVIRDEFHYSASFTTARKGVYTLSLSSPTLVMYFKKLFYVSDRLRADTKTVPSVVLNAQIPIKKAFLRGYLQGDGHYSSGGNWSFVTVSRTLALGVIMLQNAVDPKPFTVYIRDDKPKVVQVEFSNTNNNRLNSKLHKPKNMIKKMRTVPYIGHLYDLEVESDSHLFNIGIGHTKVHNSQDIAGVRRVFLRQCDNFFVGHQRDSREVQRNLDAIPLEPRLKPKPSDIQQLTLGCFYVCSNDFVKKTYIQPVWLDAVTAMKVARGEMTAEEAVEYKQEPEKPVDPEPLVPNITDVLSQPTVGLPPPINYKQIAATLQKELESYRKANKQLYDQNIDLLNWKREHGGTEEEDEAQD